MAASTIERTERPTTPILVCHRCHGRAVWLEGVMHTFDLTTGCMHSAPAFQCLSCGAITDDEVDSAPAERTRLRAHSPAARTVRLLDLLRAVW